MTTELLERPVANAAPGTAEPAVEAPPEPTRPTAPWRRIFLIGLFTGLVIGLPLVPFGDRIVQAYSDFAIAYGLPCHGAIDTTQIR